MVMNLDEEIRNAQNKLDYLKMKKIQFQENNQSEESNIHDDKPSEIRREDIDNLVKKLLNGDFDIKTRPCFKCGKDFLPNYDTEKCDECFFNQFPKDRVREFYRSFF